MEPAQWLFLYEKGKRFPVFARAKPQTVGGSPDERISRKQPSLPAETVIFHRFIVIKHMYP
jgi:hypothetical protein